MTEFMKEWEYRQFVRQGYLESPDFTRDVRRQKSHMLRERTSDDYNAKKMARYDMVRAVPDFTLQQSLYFFAGAAANSDLSRAALDDILDRTTDVIDVSCDECKTELAEFYKGQQEHFIRTGKDTRDIVENKAHLELMIENLELLQAANKVPSLFMTLKPE